MVVADNLKNNTFWIEFPYFEKQSSLTLIAMVFGYSAQIFSDFAGYSLIALGLAGLFGYTLEQNFNYPYISKSFSEFWRRWHISLSSFLREYLYIPLGGNRKGNIRTYVNLFITMVLGGLWHGAAWSYAVWGAFHGLALAIERFLKPYFRLPNWWIVSFVRMFIVYFFVTVAWLLFKLPNFSEVLEYVHCIFRNTNLTNDDNVIAYIVCYSFPVFILHFLYLLKQTAFNKHFIQKIDFVWYSIMLVLIFVNSGNSGSFIYFQF